MNGYGAADLARAFRTVRKNTITIAEEIPDTQYGFRAAEGVRSVAETLAHLAVATQWHPRFHQQGLPTFEIAYFMSERQRGAAAEAALTSKAQLLSALQTDGEAFASWLETLSDEALAQRVNFPPPLQPSSKTRFEMLMGVKEHEMHHRGQLMLIERLLGIVPHLTREYQARAAQRAQTQTA